MCMRFSDAKHLRNGSRGVESWGNSCLRAIGGSTSACNQSCHPSLGLTTCLTNCILTTQTSEYFSGRCVCEELSLQVTHQFLPLPRKDLLDEGRPDEYFSGIYVWGDMFLQVAVDCCPKSLFEFVPQEMQQTGWGKYKCENDCYKFFNVHI